MAACSNSYWKELQINLPDGTELVCRVDAPTYHACIEEKDEKVISNLIKNYQEAFPSITCTGNLENPKPKPCSSKVLPVPVCSMTDEPESISAGGTTSTESDHKEQTNWTYEGVLLLIQTYRDKEEDFKSPLIKKNEVWRKISYTLSENGHNYSADACDKKMRSLKYRYKVIADGNSETGRGRKKWEFFKVMDEFMAGDPAVRPISLVSSIEETTSEQQTPAKEKTTPPKKKRKNKDTEMPDWFRDYSEQQNKIFNEIKDNQERGVRVAEERNSILKSLATALLKTQLPNISES